MARPEAYMSGAPDEAVSVEETKPHIPTPGEELHALATNFVEDFNSKLQGASHIENSHDKDGETATISFIDRITTNKFVRTSSLLVPPVPMPENVTPIDQPESFTQYEVRPVDHPSVYVRARITQLKGKESSMEMESCNYAGEVTKVSSNDPDERRISTIHDDLTLLTEPKY